MAGWENSSFLGFWKSPRFLTALQSAGLIWVEPCLAPFPLLGLQNNFLCNRVLFTWGNLHNFMFLITKRFFTITLILAEITKFWQKVGNGWKCNQLLVHRIHKMNSIVSTKWGDLEGHSKFICEKSQLILLTVPKHPHKSSFPPMAIQWFQCPLNWYVS